MPSKSFAWLMEPSGPIQRYLEIGNFPVLQNLMREISRHFDRVYIFSPDSRDFTSLLPKKCVHEYIDVKIDFARMIAYLFLFPVLFWDIFRENDVCANHLSIVPAIIARILYGRRIISRYTWKFYEIQKLRGIKWYNVLAWLAELLTFRFSDIVIVSTIRLKHHVESRGVGRNKVVIVPDNVDPTLFRPTRKHVLSQETLKALSVGQLIPRKNFELAIRALARLQQKMGIRCHLTIVGKGPLRGRLQKTAKQLNVSLHIVSMLSRDEMIEYYNSHDLFIFCSKLEGCPVAVMEAMACGIPIVATNAEGTNDLLTHRWNGMLCDFDEEIISDTICKILLNKELVYEICANARKTIIEKHSTRECMKRFALIIQSTEHINY